MAKEGEKLNGQIGPSLITSHICFFIAENTVLFTAELPTRVGYLFLGKKAGGSHLIRVGSLIVFCRKWSGGRLLEWGRCTF